MADREILAALFREAVRAADPETCLAAHLPGPPTGRTVVVGAGKGAAQLAAAFERLWPRPVEGAVVTGYGYAVPCRRITVLEAAHPIPDRAGLAAARRLIETVSGLTAEDLVVALVTGGGSALLPAPAARLTFEDEVALNDTLLRSGAPIGVMNRLRVQASAIKGGRLALAAHPARVVTLVVSDVPGDNPAAVASGPTVPEDAPCEEALALARDYRIELPPRLVARLEEGADPPPSPCDPRFVRNEVHVIASAALSLEAAGAAARARGLPAVILSDAIEGEARDVGLTLAAMAREIAMRDRPFARPVLLLSGGETTVSLGQGKGRGGRNSEFLLSFAQAIGGLEGISALAADTDGIDGSEVNAGAFADGTTLRRLLAAGRPPARALAEHDAWGAFDALGDLFVTGPTGTNVNDFRAILVR